MGKGNRVSIYDEFMQMQEHVFDVTLPMASIENCVIVFVSSASTNFESHGLRILSARFKDNNQPVVRILTTGNPDELAETLNMVAMESDSSAFAQAKDANDKNGKQFSVTGLATNKKFDELRQLYAKDISTVLKNESNNFLSIGLISPHQSAIQMRKIEALMSDRAFKVEMMNAAVAPDSKPAFNLNSLNGLQASLFKESQTPKYIIITFDPAGGGSLSDSAWCSAFYTESGKMVLIGADVLVEDNYGETIRRLVQHIIAIRNIKDFSTCPILFVVERNLGWAAPVTCAELVKTYGASSPGENSGIYIYHDPMGKIGFTTDNTSKACMAQAFNNKLKTGQVAYHEDFLNINEAYTKDTMKALVHKQLSDYKRKLVPGKDVGQAAKEFYGGKPKKDDMAICVQMNCYIQTETFSRNIFTHSLESLRESSVIKQ